MDVEALDAPPCCARNALYDFSSGYASVPCVIAGATPQDPNHRRTPSRVCFLRLAGAILERELLRRRRRRAATMLLCEWIDNTSPRLVNTRAPADGGLGLSLLLHRRLA